MQANLWRALSPLEERIRECYERRILQKSDPAWRADAARAAAGRYAGDPEPPSDRRAASDGS